MKVLFKLCFAIVLSLTVSGQAQTKNQLVKELRIDFSNGSAEFSPNKKLVLQNSLKELNNDYSSYKVEICAQTDPLGDVYVNQQVWKARIQSMSSFLVQQGFTVNQFQVIPQNQKELIDVAAPKEDASKRNVVARIYKSSTTKGVVGGLSIEAKHFEVDAEKEQTVVSTSGTKITIPKNAFVDKKGRPIVGKVDLHFVEYRRPVDFILGGLPMDYHHNGEHYDFNSAGMFKITAQQKGTEVYLDPSKSIDMDFPLTADLPDLNFYQLDTVSKKWKEISKLTKEIPKGEQTFNNPNLLSEPFTSSNDKDSIVSSYKVMTICDSVFSHIKLGIAIANDTTHYHQYYYYADKQTMRLYNKEIQMNNIKIKKFGKKADFYQTLEEGYQAQYTFSPAVSNTEGQGFKITLEKSPANVKISKIIWIPEAGSAFSNTDFYNRHWSIDQIVAKADKSYNIVLNDSLGKIELKNVKAFLESSESAKNRDYFLKYTVATLNALAVKKKNADKGLHTNLTIKNNVDKINANYKKYKLDVKGKELQMKCFISDFWKIEKAYMPAEELAMSEEEWVAYFDTHKKELMDRFVAKKGCPEYEKCDKVDKEILIKRKDMNQAVNASAAVVKKLSISALGVYNCDQIRRLENPVEVIASYSDEKGGVIEPVFIYVVDSRLNGILRYDGHYGYSPYRFAYSPTAKTVLLAFDKKGEAYIYNAKQFEALKFEGSKFKHNFSLTKIGMLEDQEALSALIN
ncbi:hypothetical protein OX284_016280 [Flavobacterium sp. SUN046]|uniref:hypothetical protein n=1 Tax=Flavobacterium sp. SUN046 TaxID=3002440 RepID=UPI002DB953C7|nr:hypothetical protein [Flavobacterium sp. SUN046]MEC4050994.1 hypothetical protein [Flavobacterium sp. SUN046]